MSNKILCLENNSGRLHPHGSYLSEWYDKDFNKIFKIVMTLSFSTVQIVLAEAIAGVETQDYLLSEHEVSAKMGKRWAEEESIPHWINLKNKEFVLFKRDDLENIFGIYKHDYNLYLIQTKISELEKFLEHNPLKRNDRLALALEGKFES